ncbi:MAG TPA: PDZ domain-containing protein [Bacteroidota bacterium]|nr:PDZ domain-containing protein [Bacteroidota bacterium]
MNPSDEAGEKDKKDKKVSGWLGVSIQDITERIVKQKALKSDEGAYIAEILEDSPAESAGLEKGDIVVEFNGKTIYDADDLAKAASKTAPGTKAIIVVLRKGEKKTIQVTTGKKPKSHAFAFGFPRGHAPMAKIFRESHSLGLNLRELNLQLGEYFGAPEGEGVLVEEVEPKSAAEKAGFKAGDIILKIGRRSINDVQDIWRALGTYRDEGKVEAEILRKGSRKTLSVEINAAEEDIDGASWFQTFPGHGGLREFKIETPEFDIMVPEHHQMHIESELNGLQKLERIRKIRSLPEYVTFSKTI